MTTPAVALLPNQRLTERGFTDPEWSERDRAALEQMAKGLRGVLREEKPSVRAKRLDIFYLTEDDGCAHRVVVVNWAGLMACDTLTVVGFFGQRREDADMQATLMADAVMLQQFTEQPDLLSYSSLQFTDEQWGNLVLFRSPEGIDHWGGNSYHSQAAREISPNYYDSIRLHNGWLENGLWSGQSIRLQRTKYYDFRDADLWHAVREFAP
ncbi:MAG: hypothetical protein HY328_12305 [Chloroflexi bacterium]|nr:hypothetical protein [Chloroflexota bacterium]